MELQEKSYFHYIEDSGLVAANIGIHHSEWLKFDEIEFIGHQNERMLEMKEKRYDIVPLFNSKKKKYFNYVSTVEWGNFDKISTQKIDDKLSIYYLTHIEDLIRKMVENKVNFYFLNNYYEIIGLITISDLNSKYFYKWLYSKIINLEKGIAIFLLNNIAVEDKLEALCVELSKSDDDEGELFKDSIDRHKQDRAKNSDRPFIEYLYFSQLIRLIREFKLYKKLGYKDRGLFEFNNSKIKNIRNTVAHPVKSLVHDKESLSDLWKGLQKMEELVGKLIVTGVKR